MYVIISFFFYHPDGIGSRGIKQCSCQVQVQVYIYIYIYTRRDVRVRCPAAEAAEVQPPGRRMSNRRGGGRPVAGAADVQPPGQQRPAAGEAYVQTPGRRTSSRRAADVQPPGRWTSSRRGGEGTPPGRRTFSRRGGGGTPPRLTHERRRSRRTIKRAETYTHMIATFIGRPWCMWTTIFNVMTSQSRFSRIRFTR